MQVNRSCRSLIFQTFPRSVRVGQLGCLRRVARSVVGAIVFSSLSLGASLRQNRDADVAGELGDRHGGRHGVRGRSSSSPLAQVYGDIAKDARPKGADKAVELLRFVTAYRSSMEAIVDITPYTPLIRAASGVGSRSQDTLGTKGLDFYAFIDSWVGNSSGTDAMFYNNNTRTCTPIVHSDGNAFSLSADLIFWPKKRRVQPRETLTLASGYFGANLPFGEIIVHEGNLSENKDAIVFKEGVDLIAVSSSSVYSCPLGATSLKSAGSLGYFARRAEKFERMSEEEVLELYNSTKRDLLILFQNNIFETIVSQQLVGVNVVSVDEAGMDINVTYNPSHVSLEPGMPAYFSLGDVFTERNLTKKLIMNTTYPFEAVGHVIEIYKNGTASHKRRPLSGSLPMSPTDDGTRDVGVARLHLDRCLPTNRTRLNSTVPRLMVPVKSTTLGEAQQLVEALMRWGRMAASATTSFEKKSKISTERGGDAEPRMPLFLDYVPADLTDEHGRFEAPRILGNILAREHVASKVERFVKTLPLSTPQVETGGLPGMSEVEVGSSQRFFRPKMTHHKHHHKHHQKSKTTSSFENAGQDRVCVVEQHHQGRLVDENFHVETLEEGDRVVMQLAVTGHGWAQTSEQCGEYCHALYQLRFNGNEELNVTQWRDDCHMNPLSDQAGTWQESRNGWCPGTVVPGTFVDITEMVRSGENRLLMDVLVWSNETGRYDRFTDLSGFAMGDRAFLTVGLNLFVYDASVVAAVKAQERSYSAAEAALRHRVGGVGTVNPALNPFDAGGLIDESVDPDIHGPAASLLSTANQIRPVASARHPAGRPFHFEARKPWYLYNTSNEEDLRGITRVPAFTDVLMQGNSRIVTAHVDKQFFPEEWGEVALHFQLRNPPAGLAMDHWDRLGSIGLCLTSEQMPSLELHTPRP